MRTGGLRASIVRICTGEVCVRSSSSGPSQNVSRSSRDGWCLAVLSASKLLNSVSMSGPSATVKPICAKMRVTSSVTSVSGCSEPAPRQLPGIEKSNASCAAPSPATASLRASSASVKAVRSALSACPNAGLSAGGTSRRPFMRAVSEPLRPRNLMRTPSTSSGVFAAATAASASAWNWGMSWRVMARRRA